MQTWLADLHAIPHSSFRRLSSSIPALESRLETLLSLGENDSDSDHGESIPFPAPRASTVRPSKDEVLILNDPGVRVLPLSFHVSLILPLCSAICVGNIIESVSEKRRPH
jgi:hypothetical protein